MSRTRSSPSAIPKTLTGKLLGVPVQRLLMGRDARASRDAMVNPDSLDRFIDFADGTRG